MSFYLSTRRTVTIAAVVFFALFCFIRTDAQEVWQKYQKNGININYTGADQAEIAKIAAFISNGNKTIKAFFGQKFPNSYEVYVFPDRKSLTEFWRRDWNVPDLETECWMVASGTASKLTLLSPRVWRTEACEHNPEDEKDTQLVMTHEMVHVFHGQISPNPNFEGMDDIGWFAEGVATYASGQLEAGKLASPREAIEKGKAPAELEKAWSGKYRYGVSGSLVKFIDAKFGRKTLLRLLKSTNEKELLEVLKISENELLSGWKDFVSKG